MNKKTTTQRAKPAPVSLPPILAVLSAYAEGDDRLVREQFLTAWRQIPAMVTQIAAGEGDSAKGTTRWALIEAGVDAELSRKLAGNDYAVMKAQHVQAIRDTNPDLWTEIQIVVGDAAFNAGLALGLYLLTTQPPITTGGAR
jgi:hypothetical protein